MTEQNGIDTSEVDSKPNLDLYLVAPRGFCAGVERAIEIVEQCLEAWGAPVYVRHEIVHNEYVVNSLRKKGAVFVEELNECPEDRPVVLSAHGVAKSVIAEAKDRNLNFVDAVCPLVSKVHVELQKNYRNGLQTIMIGHSGHPETTGTIGQLPEGEVLLVESVADVETLAVKDPEQLAYVTQTTLSVDDTQAIADALGQRFPKIKGPHKSDICYATTNRQQAIKEIIDKVDYLLVVGSPNSSNSNRLVEVALTAGCPMAKLISGPEDLDIDAISKLKSIGLTSGASAPEILIEGCKKLLHEYFNLNIISSETVKETVTFNLPKIVRN